MLLAFDYGDTHIEFEVSYRKRKTMAIVVEPPGIVKVVAPIGTPENVVVEKVKAKAHWIFNKLQEVREVNQIDASKEYVSGESFKYLGRNYSLQLIIDPTVHKPYVDLNRNNLTVVTPTRDEAKIQKALESWYRTMACEQISARIKHHQPKIGIMPNKVVVKDQKKRWGSCSKSGNLYFNWRAVMAPANVLDYIIVHELCHLVHHNHSSEFWKLVSSVIPDYRLRMEWLRNNGVRFSQ